MITSYQHKQCVLRENLFPIKLGLGSKGGKKIQNFFPHSFFPWFNSTSSFPMQGAAPGCDHPVTASLLSHTFPPTFSLVCMSSQQAVVPPGNTYLLWCSSWRPIYSGMASPTGHPTGESQLSGEPSLCSFSHLGLHRVASHASLHLTLRSAAFLPSLKACFAEALPSWLLGPAVP